MRRVYWIDNAKAIGIFFVVLAHHNINFYVMAWIYSFHMPLFFFLSGYLFDFSKYPDIKDFFIRKIRTLIVPYFFFAFLSYAFWLFIVRNISIHGVSISMDPLRPFIGIFYGVGVDGWNVPLDGALWFLPCLFTVEMLMWVFSKFFARDLLRYILIGSAGLGYFISISGMPFRLPWGFEVALTGLVFYGWGFFLKKRLSDWLNKKYLGIVMMPILIISIWTSVLNGRIDMDSNHYGSIGLFYISAMCGIFFFIGVSKMILSNHVLSYIGRNTLIIMGLSGTSFFIVRGILYILLKEMPSTEHVQIQMAMIYSIAQILFLVPIIILLNRFCPYILGRDR